MAEPHHPARTAVRGVKICCDGEMRLSGSEPFVPINVTRENREALGEGSILSISARLGMPIRLWKEPGSEFPHGLDSNQNVAFCMVGTDPAKEAWWGWAPPYWNTNIGNVWAVREDGQDLSAGDIRKMCYFARGELQIKFESAMESGNSLARRQRVTDFITWDNMLASR